MKILSLKIDNFMPIGHAELSLDGKGLVLLQGVNKDDSSAVSNGAGKSTIPDALCWALFGTTARGESGDAIVNDKAKKDCAVQVTLQDGAAHYMVTRYRKHSKMKNAVVLAALDPATGTATDLTRGTNDETDAEIIRIMGCTLDVFAAAIYSGQDVMPDIPGMTDKQLKMLVEQAAGIERIEKAYEVARAKKVELERKAQIHEVNLAGALRHVQQGEAMLLSLANDKDAWATNQDLKIADITVRLDARKADFATKAAVVKGYDKAGVEGKLLTARAGLASWQTAQETLRVARQVLTSEQNKLTKIEAEARHYALQAQQIKQQIAGGEEMLSKPCQMCGKPHTPDEREQWLGHQQQRLEELKEPLAREVARVQAQREVIAKLTAGIAKQETLPAPAELIKEMSDLEAQLRKITSDTDELRRMVADQKADEAEVARLRAEPNPIAATIARVTAELENRRKIHADTVKQGAELAHDLAVAEDCVKVFGPAGVRAHILDTVTPFLNERTAHYLTVLSDGNMQAVWTTLTKSKGGELKEKFSIEVTNAKGGKSFGLQSGGQKRKVQLACILALQDLVATRATKPIDLWIGDEIDDALDPAGLERLMAILEERARERGTVLVVSHNELRDWIDNVATITLEAGFSKVEGALC